MPSENSQARWMIYLSLFLGSAHLSVNYATALQLDDVTDENFHQLCNQYHPHKDSQKLEPCIVEYEAVQRQRQKCERAPSEEFKKEACLSHYNDLLKQWKQGQSPFCCDPPKEKVARKANKVEEKRPSRSGLTWKKYLDRSTTDLPFVGCAKCNAYQGDTSCSTKLPILCLKKEGLPKPSGLVTDYYKGWTGGHIGLTKPVGGNELTGISDANLLCEQELGSGYQMAEFHDGGGGWGYYGYGNVDDNSRFWTYINGQDANCWGG